MIKLGKLFQKSIILTEKIVSYSADSMWLKKFARVASSKSYM